MAKIDYETVYEYNENKQLIKTTFMHHYSYGDEIITITIHAYDGNGRLIREDCEYLNLSAKSYFLYEYNDNGQLSRRLIFKDDALSSIYTYKYNAEGKVILVEEKSPRGVVLSYTKTRYTKKGYTKRNYKGNGDPAEPAIIVYECDEKGNILIETDFDSYGNKTFWSERYYDTKGLLIKEVIYNENCEVDSEEYNEYIDDLLVRHYVIIK